MPDPRIEAAEAYVRSIRTGELSAARALAPLLSPDVVLSTGPEEVTGYDAVLTRASGRWAHTDGLWRAGWDNPRVDGDEVVIDADFGHLPIGPASMSFRFSFAEDGKIARIEQQTTPRPPVAPTETIPLAVRALINTARVNNTPMVFAYVDEAGKPVQSFRGGVQVYSDTELCAWIRHADGGLIRSVATNPRVSLAYPFTAATALLLIEGTARVEADEATRRRVFDLLPEQEQNHDPELTGAALLIDITSLQGFTPAGPVRMVRQS
ncbi:MAG: hypothetical protein AB7T32_01075 [Dehalococcoidia bacterium]